MAVVVKHIPTYESLPWLIYKRSGVEELTELNETVTEVHFRLPQLDCGVLIQVKFVFDIKPNYLKEKLKKTHFF